MSQDLEDLLPVASITKENDRIRVVHKGRKNDYVETDIVPIFKEIINNQYINRNSRSCVLNTVCLTIEDVKRSKPEEDVWKFHSIAYKNVLIYGKVVFLNESTNNNRTYYTLSIDDETECITGYLNKLSFKEKKDDKNVNDLKKVKSLVQRRKETGITIYGQYFPSESEECQTAIDNLRKLQIMIDKNLRSSERNFPLGPLKEKALIHATPILRNEAIKLSIFDFCIDDNLDLIWKRNINRLYSDFYFK